MSIPLVGLLERYFRSEVRGLDRLPAGRCLMVGNHNAGVAFLEPLLLGKAWWERTGGRVDIHALAHSTLLDLPGFGNLLTMFGAVRADHEAAGRVFALDRKVWVFPGGAYEAFRPWRERRRVDFGGHTGFVRLALRHRVPIVPVLCFGGHEAFFVLTRGEALARATGFDRWYHARVLPVYLGLPWGVGVGPVPHLPLPVRVVLEVGDAIPTSDLPEDAGRDEALVQDLYHRVVCDLQARMDREVVARRKR